MENNMACKGCGKPETECLCPGCPCKGGACETGSECCKPGVCDCPHHKFMPVLIILFGLVFLLQALDVLNASTSSMLWPIIVIVAGFAKLKGGMCKCYHKHY
jgi:hypothetical protein